MTTLDEGSPSYIGPRDLDLPADELAALCFAAIRDAATPDAPAWSTQLEAYTAPCYVALRRDGQRAAHGWTDGDGSLPSILTTIRQLVEGLDPAARSELDAIELNLTHDWQTTDLGDKAASRTFLSNFVRGVRGFELVHAEYTLRVAPSQAVAQNRAYPKWLEVFRQERRLTQADVPRQVVARSFRADQLLLMRPSDGAAPRGVPMFRGNSLVPQEQVNRGFVEQLERDLGDFLVRAVLPTGRMTYIYYPSQGREDLKRNNMIRQWMASVALGRTAAHRAEPSIHKLGEENIRYNLRTFYHATGKLGCIEHNGKVKLGSVALAVISIMEHPKRKQFKRVEERLWNMIEHLWQPDGSFRTFFKPSERNDVQNFYPGEAQLAWAFRYTETGDEALLERFMSSMRYYRAWHKEQRNPAFVPWHAQAYYHVWKHTKDDELKDWVFDISDWLLCMAQYDHNVLHADELGRFYDPENPGFGPPHASATGVYLEGLIDAFELAREVGDEARRERYRLAIIRGLRSVRQVMFKDDVDMFYISPKNRPWLRGGVRNTVYDNVMRIDNVQHNQMGIIKILRAFEDEDFLEDRG